MYLQQIVRIILKRTIIKRYIMLTRNRDNFYHLSYRTSVQFHQRFYNILYNLYYFWSLQMHKSKHVKSFGAASSTCREENWSASVCTCIVCRYVCICECVCVCACERERESIKVKLFTLSQLKYYYYILP